MPGSIIYIPHGGGPLPLLKEPNHQELIDFLTHLPDKLTRPKSIVVVSAHWEEDITTVSCNPKPELIYDYYGFSPESYQIEYSAVGSPKLANRIKQLLERAGILAEQDSRRGLDHGAFVPLKLMYSNADIPVVQLSLTKDLLAEHQIKVGQSIAELVNEGAMLLGSGMSFHNLNQLMNNNPEVVNKSQTFDQWLNESLLSQKLDWQQKSQRLIDWQSAPFARFAHPREEHLMPLHVCFGAAKKLKLRAENIFDKVLLNAKVSSFLWQQA